MRRKVRQRLRRLVFSVLPLPFLLAIAELLLRYMFSGFDYLVVIGNEKQTSKVWADPSVWRRVQDEWRMILMPNPRNGVNEQGYRGRLVPQKKTSSLLRILNLGDSTTYGVGVNSQETYSAQLETVLAEHSCNAEVLNAGVPSYTSRQGWAALTLQWVPYRPDVFPPISATMTRVG